METMALEQRAKELKERLSLLGKMVHEGKYFIAKHCNSLHTMKKRLYELERERVQYDDIWNYSDVKVAENAIAIHNLKEDINSTKEQLKEENQNQKELISEVKRVNSEYSKLERRLQRKQSKL